MDTVDVQAHLHPEDDALAGVRARVAQAAAVPDTGAGALLAHLAAQHGVRHAAVVGSAGAIACAWLLDGMAPRGIITCLEPDGRRHALLGDAAGELGIADRIRMINADPVEAAERLSDGNYDLVLVQVPEAGHELLDVAARLLKVGGVLVLRHAASAHEDAVYALAGPPWTDTVALDTADGIVLTLRGHDPE